MSAPYIHLHPKDNVLVALESLEAGSRISFEGKVFKLRQHIPAKHKFTITELKTGDEIVMYGVLVGMALQRIPLAGLISIHNVTNATEAYSAGIKNYNWTAPDTARWKGRTFDGYHRKDGRVGTANYWLVLPLTFCENRGIEIHADRIPGLPFR